MKKLHCIICDRCRKVIKDEDLIVVKGKKRELHYCSEKCKDKNLKK